MCNLIWNKMYNRFRSKVYSKIRSKMYNFFVGICKKVQEILLTFWRKVYNCS
jgi:hypothetical protein